jgi:hypothetical protein
MPTSFAVRRENRSQRARAILAADPARAWDIGKVCKWLATTGNTLRCIGRELAGCSFI